MVLVRNCSYLFIVRVPALGSLFSGLLIHLELESPNLPAS